ncbi:MAG: hypothetical protein R3F56_11765 [Planctomycetota bacterium]
MGLAVAQALTWTPPLPERAVRAMRPREGPRLLEPAEGGVVGERLSWLWGGAPRPWHVVILDAEYAELARLGPTEAGARSVPFPAALAERLASGPSAYWYVESADRQPRVRSRLSAFVAPAR